MNFSAFNSRRETTNYKDEIVCLNLRTLKSENFSFVL